MKTVVGNFFVCSCFLLNMFFKQAYALTLSYEASVGVEWSDNITRVEENSIQQITTVYDLSGTLTHQARKYSFNLRPNIIYRDYQGEQFADQTFTTFDGTLLYRIRPGTFDWSFENFLTQTLVDQQAVPTPFGLQDTNVFLTGPDMNVNIGNGKSLMVAIRYGNFYYSETDTDNDRAGMRIRFNNNTNPVEHHAISFDAASIRYENTLDNENYKRDDLYYIYNRRGIRASTELQIGFTRISPQKQADFQDLMGLLRLRYEINRHNDVLFELHSWYTDTSRNFLTSRAYNEGVRRFSSAISGYVFREDFSYLRYSWDRDNSRLDFEISGGHHDYMGRDDYLDRKLGAIFMGLTRDLSRRLAVILRGRFTRANYYSQQVINIDKYLTLGFRYRIGRNLNLNLNYSNNSRNIENEDGGYEENLVYLNLAYIRR